MKVFVDETAWNALLLPADPEHERMQASFTSLLDNHTKLFTHNIAVGNTLTRIRTELGPAAAGKFNETLEEAYAGAYLTILWIGRRTQKEASRLLRGSENTGLGLYDFAAVRLMQRRRIQTILTTRFVFREYGLRIIPEDGEGGK